MMLRSLARAFVLLAMSTPNAAAQGTRADYERAHGLRGRFEDLATGLPEPATFIENTREFWYRRFVKGGYEFVAMNADTQAKRPAFDHEKLAAGLSKVMGGKPAALALPAQGFKITDKGTAVELVAKDSRWRCDLADYACRKLADLPVGFVQIPFACSPPTPDDKPVASPDGRWEALVLNYNLAVREAGAASKPVSLSTDGSEANCYQRASIQWSPDSSKIAAYRIRPGYRRMVHYVQSSPEDQLQPKKPDHPGKLGGAGSEQGGRGEGAGLVQRGGDEPRGSLPSRLLPRQLRRHRSHAPDRGRLESSGHLLGRHEVLRRHLLTRRSGAGLRAAPSRGWFAGHRDRAERYRRAQQGRLGSPRRFRGQGAGRRHRHRRRDLQASELRPEEEVSGDRVDLRGAARIVRAEVVRRPQSPPRSGGDGFHRGADRRHGHVEPVEGLPRRGLAEPRRRRLPRPDPLAQGAGREVPLVRHHAGGHLRRLGRRSERFRRPLVPSRVLQGRGLLRGLPRQSHGQDLVERAVDGLAPRPAILGLIGVDHAGRLKGKVLFVLGEMDSNVDPSSTLQVANALIKANKKFDLLVVPGAEHNAGRGGESGPYGERLRFDFFVQNLLGVMPPNWNEDAPQGR